MALAFPPLRLVQSFKGSDEQRRVEVCLTSLRVEAEGVFVTLEIQFGDIHKIYHEQHPDILGLFERTLYSAIVVLTYGIGGERGRDYDLFTEDGAPWPILRHLRLPDDPD